MGTKVIKNGAGITQSVVYQGRQITLLPYAEERMDEVLADVFISRCAPVVEEIKDETEQPYDVDSANTIWVANVTGNPIYPAEINSKTLQNKKWVHTQAPNPSAKPHPVTYEWDEGQKPYTGRDGSWLTLNMPKVPITVPAFKRKAFGRDIGTWILRQEGANVKYTDFSPAIVKSRAPTPYEPDMDWDLDEINAYLMCISSGGAKLAPSEAHIAGLTKEHKWTKAQVENELNIAKKSAIETAYYYVVDPKFRLPTRSEVRELMTGKVNTEVVNAQVDRIMGSISA